MPTDFQRRKLRTLFDLHDLDHDGYLQADDMEGFARMVCSARGVPADSAEAARIAATLTAWWEGMRDHADKDDDGRVDFEEWLGFMDEMVEPGPRSAFARPITEAVFGMLDQDHDGVVTADEYAALAAHL